MALTTQQKARALYALASGFALRIRPDGSWYASLPGVEVMGDGMLSSPNQSEPTPDAAIEKAWEQYATGQRLAIDAYGASRREVEWSGFIWRDLPRPASKAVAP